jgi:hypothetical protein
MHPTRQSVTERSTYRTLRAALADLHRAEQTLTDIERVAPDVERASHLATIRAVLAKLEDFVRSLPAR